MMPRTTDERTESRIALFAGGDLDERSAAELRRQLANCPDARVCRDEMNESLAVLHECRDRVESAEPGQSSLWPRLAPQLRLRRRTGPLESLRPWVPAMTVAALVLALLTVVTSPPPRTDGSFAVQMPNAYQPSFQPVNVQPRRPQEAEFDQVHGAGDQRQVPYYAVPAHESVEYDFLDDSAISPGIE